MCVSSQAWFRLQRNNYPFQTDDSNDWHLQKHTQRDINTLLSPFFFCEDTFSWQHIFHNLWQLAIKLAERKHKSIIVTHKTRCPFANLRNNNTGTLADFSDRLSDHYQPYWLFCFHSERNRLTDTMQPALLIGDWNLCKQRRKEKAHTIQWKHLSLSHFCITCYWWKKSSGIIVRQRRSERERR